jgi:hypothetical protein
MRNDQTAERMRGDHGLRAAVIDSSVKGADPFAPVRMVPVPLVDTPESGVSLFPAGLPVPGSGIPDAGQDQDGNHPQGVSPDGPGGEPINCRSRM